MYFISRLLNNDDMKIIEEIHRDNLQRLADEYGSVAAVANQIGCSSSQYSQWLNGSENSGTGKPRGMRPSSARRIEKACGKPAGWMDMPHDTIAKLGDTEDKRLTEREKPFIRTVSAYDSEDGVPDDVVLVPESKIEFAGGDGRINYELIEDEEPATYRRSWFQKYGINPDRVRRFRVTGDSMEPLLYARDTILVNEDETNVIDGRLYALRYGDQLRVKYLSRRIDGTLILRSVNPAYKDEEITGDMVNQHITIIGRVRDRSGTGGL